MERGAFRRFYERNIVPWSLVLLVLGVILSTVLEL